MANSASGAGLEDVLRSIQSEPLGAVRTREANAFDQMAGLLAGRLVLFGAGPLGKQSLAGLRLAGLEPLAFADNNAKLWGKDIDGLTVLSPDEAKARYGDSACFVVTIYNGSSVRQQLTALGCKTVIPFAPLFWKYPEIFIPDSCVDLPHNMRGSFDEIRACNSLLHDECSRRELRGQLAWRYWLDYDSLGLPLDPRHTYCPFDLVSPLEDEVFVDCGSFDGPSVRSFAEHWNNKFRRVIAIEPDPVNRAALTKNIAAIGLDQKVMILPYALGDQNGPISFTCTGSVTSHIGGNGSACTVECRKLDDIDWPLAPTYIKMDIESAEPQALRGAAETLQRYQPVLAICTYHRSEHLWQIPNLIHSINPEYHIFLRRYAEECWEGVCYAIPPHRLKRS